LYFIKLKETEKNEDKEDGLKAKLALEVI